MNSFVTVAAWPARIFSQNAGTLSSSCLRLLVCGMPNSEFCSTPALSSKISGWPPVSPS